MISRKTILGLGMSLVVSAGIFAVQAVPTSGTTTAVVIDRDDVGDLAVAYSSMISGLEKTRLDLSTTYSDMKRQLEGLETLYDNLSSYQMLYDFYNAMPSAYQTYLGVALVTPQTLDVYRAALFVDNPANPDIVVLDVIIADIAGTPEHVANYMSIENYGAYVALKAGYDAMGITNPHLSKQEEYDTFVYPLEVAPMQLQTSMMSLGVSIEQAKASLAAGATSLYDGILTLEGYKALQIQSYMVAKNDYLKADSQYSRGLISETAYQKAVNDEKIARMAKDSMIRQVDNLVMQLNVMLGQDVTTELTLSTPAGLAMPEELLDVEVYIARALENRAELKTLAYDIMYKEHEVSYIEKYFSSSNLNRKIAAAELEALNTSVATKKRDIEAEIRQAYMNVQETEKAYTLRQHELADAKRQYDQLELNVELGYVTGSMLGSMELLMIQKQEAVESANRDYLNALTALKNASSIGPGLSAQGGF